VTFVVPTGNKLPDVCEAVIVGVAVQLSVTVGGVHQTLSAVAAVACIISVGQSAKTGAMVSFKHGFAMVIVNEQVAALFFASFAV
jgi:hypothetical protein